MTALLLWQLDCSDTLTVMTAWLQGQLDCLDSLNALTAWMLWQLPQQLNCLDCLDCLDSLTTLTAWLPWQLDCLDWLKLKVTVTGQQVSNVEQINMLSRRDVITSKNTVCFSNKTSSMVMAMDKVINLFVNQGSGAISACSKTAYEESLTV